MTAMPMAGEAGNGEKSEGAAWWAPGAHFQTTWGRLGRSRRLVAFRREILTTPDDDDLVLDHLDGPAGAPRVLLLHGLEGSSYSVYMQGLARLLAGAGWQATALNFRSCARDPERLSRSLPNRRPRLYHSGDTGDLDFVVRDARGARAVGARCTRSGVSLGGNVLLKWLGEQGARSRIEAAVTISVPYDLRGGGAPPRARASGAFYAAHVPEDAQAPRRSTCCERFPVAGRARWTRSASPRARTFFEFDDAATAPLHGFASADDLLPALELDALPRPHRGAGALPGQRRRSVPARRSRSSARAARVSEDVELVTTPWGGHAAFVTGRWPWKARYWAEERAVELADHAALLVCRPRNRRNDRPTSLRSREARRRGIPVGMVRRSNEAGPRDRRPSVASISRTAH